MPFSIFPTGHTAYSNHRKSADSLRLARRMFNQFDTECTIPANSLVIGRRGSPILAILATNFWCFLLVNVHCPLRFRRVLRNGSVDEDFWVFCSSLLLWSLAQWLKRLARRALGIGRYWVSFSIEANVKLSNGVYRCTSF